MHLYISLWPNDFLEVIPSEFPEGNGASGAKPIQWLLYKLFRQKYTTGRNIDFEFLSWNNKAGLLILMSNPRNSIWGRHVHPMVLVWSMPGVGGPSVEGYSFKISLAALGEVVDAPWDNFQCSYAKRAWIFSGHIFPQKAVVVKSKEQHPREACTPYALGLIHAGCGRSLGRGILTWNFPSCIGRSHWGWSCLVCRCHRL